MWLNGFSNEINFNKTKKSKFLFMWNWIFKRVRLRRVVKANMRLLIGISGDAIRHLTVEGILNYWNHSVRFDSRSHVMHVYCNENCLRFALCCSWQSCVIWLKAILNDWRIFHSSRFSIFTLCKEGDSWCPLQVNGSVSILLFLSWWIKWCQLLRTQLHMDR